MKKRIALCTVMVHSGCMISDGQSAREGDKTMTTTRTRDEIAAEIKAVSANGKELNRLHNEGTEGYDHTDDVRIDELCAEWDAAIIAEWDLETTTARRKIWNDTARTLIAGRTRMTPAEGNKLEMDLADQTGIKQSELKAAIARHSL